MDNRPIGVFDSGIGGMTVAAEILKLMPKEHIVYYGDNANTPYGTKSAETIIGYARNTVAFLLGKDVKAIVVACNTSSALALPTIREISPVPVVGVLVPGARAAVRASKNGRIGVIATEATVKSRAYEKAIKDTDPEARVYGVSAQGFVLIAESGDWTGEQALSAARSYMEGFRGTGIDTLVLGCTHFPLLREVIIRALEEAGCHGVTLVDPAAEAAAELAALLKDNGGSDIVTDQKVERVSLYTSGPVGNYVELTKLITGVEL